jgi:hypothetical protein
MPAVISESYQSRPFSLGQQPGRELVYDIVGTDDESEVETLLLSTSATVYLGLVRESASAEPQGGGVWKGYVRYTRFNDSEYTFDTGGGTNRITQSLATVNSYAPTSLVAPNFQGAIGVSDDRVEGAEVPGRNYQFTETHRFADGSVNSTFKSTLFSLTGRYNNATFKGFSAGECLLLAVTGSKRGDEDWSLTYRFACSPNITGLTVGTITGISKLGWHYLWVRYADFEDSLAYAVVKRPVAAYVERVLEPGDFSLLGIGT